VGPNQHFPQKVPGACSPEVKSPGGEANHSHLFISANSEGPELHFNETVEACGGLQCRCASYMKVGVG
jgi:hypothetical protein